MRIAMKYPKHFYENCNEIPQQYYEICNEIFLELLIIMKYPGNIMKIIMKYSRHYYENCNEVSQALL